MVYSLPTDFSERHVAVIGTGTLGRRVGLVWAAKGGVVKMVDTNEKAASEAVAWIKERLPARVKEINGSEGKIIAEGDAQEAVKGAWQVIECIPEIVEAKAALFGNLDKWTSPDCILATISSSIKSGDIVDNVSEEGKARVCNTHYFLPPDMPPVEIMTCGKTDPRVLDFIAERVREIGLDPAIAKKESTGLIYNRVWAAMKREIMLALQEECATPEDIDKLFRYSFQSKIAPCELMDEVGLQTVCDIEEHYIEERGNIPSAPVDYIRKNYVDRGHLGVQSGKGLYDYSMPKKQSVREQLIGAWELIDYVAFKPKDRNDKVYPMGKDVGGIIMYTPDGYMSAQLHTPGQPPFKSFDLNGGTDEEYAESGKNYLAYTGQFYLDESGEETLLQHHMRNCSFPNWLGDTQRRIMKITQEGNDRFLTLGPEGPSMVMGEDRIAQLKWRSLPNNYATTGPTE